MPFRAIMAHSALLTNEIGWQIVFGQDQEFLGNSEFLGKADIDGHRWVIASTTDHGFLRKRGVVAH